MQEIDQPSLSPTSDESRIAMMSEAELPNLGSWTFGIALLAVAGFFLFFGREIHAIGLGSNHDPGPKFLPVSLAGVIALGGFVEIGAAIFRSWSESRSTQDSVSRSTSRSISNGSTHTADRVDDHEVASLVDSPVDASDSSNVFESKRGLAKFLSLFGMLTAYVFAIPWIGFQISTIAFASGMLTILGARPRSALFVAFFLVVIVRLLFVGFFRIPLPNGPWNLAI